MKPFALLMIAAALLGAPSSASSQTGSIGNVTFALTLSRSEAGTVLKDPETGKVVSVADGGGPTYSNEWTITKSNAGGDPISEESVIEYVAKIVTSKYGNKELLQDLLVSGILPAVQGATEPSIAGWAIVEVTPTEDDGAVSGPGTSQLYAVHSNKVDKVDLSAYLGGGALFTADSGTFRWVYKANFVTGAESITTTDTYTWKGDGAFNIEFDSEDPLNTFFLDGIATGSGRLASITTTDAENQTVKLPVHLLGAQKLGGISGNGPPRTDLTGEDLIPVIEGSISISPGKPVLDLSEYPNLGSGTP